MNKQVAIEVVYATKDKQQLLCLNVEEGSTVEAAILASGILTTFPEIDLTTQSVGVFSEPVALDQVVKAGNRIEIYRPLAMDPKIARRLRAKQGK